MTLFTRFVPLIGALLLLGACAHQPAQAPAREPIVVTAPAAPTAPVAPTPSTAVTPSLAMPSEWQHHNGEDYDD